MQLPERVCPNKKNCSPNPISSHDWQLTRPRTPPTTPTASPASPAETNTSTSSNGGTRVGEGPPLACSETPRRAFHLPLSRLTASMTTVDSEDWDSRLPNDLFPPPPTPPTAPSTKLLQLCKCGHRVRTNRARHFLQLLLLPLPAPGSPCAENGSRLPWPQSTPGEGVEGDKQALSTSPPFNSPQSLPSLS